MAKERGEQKGFIDRHPLVSALAVAGALEFARRWRRVLQNEVAGYFLGPDGRLHEHHYKPHAIDLNHERVRYPVSQVRKDISATSESSGSESPRAETDVAPGLPHFYDTSSSLFGKEGLSAYLERTERERREDA